MDSNYITIISIAVSAIATVFLAIITRYLAYYTYNLWQSTNKTIEDNKEFYNKQLRAYIGVENFEIENTTKKIQVTFLLKNFGQTLASNVNTSTDLKFEHIKNINLKDVHSGAVIFPNDNSYKIYSEINDLDSDTSNLSNYKLEIYIKIKYLDIFKKQCETNLGYFYDPNNSKWLPIGNANNIQ